MDAVERGVVYDKKAPRIVRDAVLERDEGEVRIYVCGEWLCRKR